jgi:hypothetical protein
MMKDPSAFFTELRNWDYKLKGVGEISYHLGGDFAPHKPTPTPNGPPIHTFLCKTIKNVMSSAAESETGGVYLNGKETIPICTTASELGHPQPPTPIKTDNTTAHGIVTKTLRPKLSKAFDMRFHWMKDRIKQKQFHLYWEKGALNMADYFTKHHPPRHHKLMRNKYLQNENSIATT